MTICNRPRRSWMLPLALLLLLVASDAGAQGETPVDSLRTVARPAPAPPRRLSWYTDDTPLKVGDLVTVLINETTQASESVSEQGRDRRNSSANMTAVADGKAVIGNTGFASQWDAESRQGGQASRQGNLVGEITVRVASIDPDGRAELQGTKSVQIDGRAQEISLQGWIRPEDLSPANVIHSTRLADASITYKGKKMGPKLGIIGKVVSILWPF